jgi:hypothetical protein
MTARASPGGRSLAASARAEISSRRSPRRRSCSPSSTLGETDGYVFEEIAECLLALGRDDEARPSFARAYELLSRDPDEVDPVRLERLRALGGL